LLRAPDSRLELSIRLWRRLIFRWLIIRIKIITLRLRMGWMGTSIRIIEHECNYIVHNYIDLRCI
jgi:hypothetical protein